MSNAAQQKKDRVLGETVRKLVKRDGLLCIHVERRFGQIIVRTERLDLPKVMVRLGTLDEAVAAAADTRSSTWSSS